MLLLLLIACSTDLTVTTYNAGLAVGFVRGAESRAPLVADAVAELDADVVCLQEAWLPEHAQALAAARPHAYFPDAAPEIAPEPACEADDLEPMLQCLRDACTDVCADDLPDCVLENCALDFLRLEKSCQGCAQATIGSTPDEVAATCLEESPLYAYGGSFGTGLLARSPLGSTEHLVLESTTNRRGVIHAVVDDVDVYCTHLTAVFSVIPYPKDEGSWAEEQLAQIDRVMAWIDETATSDRRVLMGDLNTGPEVGENEAEQPESWSRVAAAGMADPYADLDGRCTFCPDNPLVGDGEPVLIDHALTTGLEAVEAERVLDAALTAQSCGADFDAALSDHYGVRVVLAR